MNISDPFVYLLVRVVLGTLFFFQAYDKIFRIKLKEVCLAVDNDFRKHGIPNWLSNLYVYMSSYIELIGGILLVLGLFTLPVLYLLGIHLVILFISFSLLQGIWDMRHVFPRFILLLILFLLPCCWNYFSLDFLLF